MNDTIIKEKSLKELKDLVSKIEDLEVEQKESDHEEFFNVCQNIIDKKNKLIHELIKQL